VEVLDWAFSPLKKCVDEDRTDFNIFQDPKYFREDEVDYMIQMLRKNQK